MTMTLSEAPLGAEQLLGPEVPPEATTGTPDVVALHRGGHGFDAAASGSSDDLSSDEMAADADDGMSQILPSDQMVYGGKI